MAAVSTRAACLSLGFVPLFEAPRKICRAATLVVTGLRKTLLCVMFVRGLRPQNQRHYFLSGRALMPGTHRKAANICLQWVAVQSICIVVCMTARCRQISAALWYVPDPALWLLPACCHVACISGSSGGISPLWNSGAQGEHQQWKLSQKSISI